MKSTAKIHAIFSRPEVFTDIEIMINGKSHTNAQIAKKSNSINKYITKLVLLEKARELRKNRKNRRWILRKNAKTYSIARLQFY